MQIYNPLSIGVLEENLKTQVIDTFRKSTVVLQNSSKSGKRQKKAKKRTSMENKWIQSAESVYRPKSLITIKIDNQTKCAKILEHSLEETPYSKLREQNLFKNKNS
jgi:hypothetical protein